MRRSIAIFVLACTVFLAGWADSQAQNTATRQQPGVSASALRLHLTAAHRTPKQRARDKYRHPAETLAFFGLQQDMTVVELWPGGGWYTDVIAPIVRDQGQFIAASFGADSSPDYRPRLHKALTEKLNGSPETYGTPEIIAFAPPERTRLADPGTVDMVLTFRNTHGWINNDQTTSVFQAAFTALKSGGVFGVVQHRAAPGADASVTAKSGYVPEAYVIKAAEAIGFKFAGSSEINANSRDTRDHPEGVWTLPPSLRLEDQDRDQYLAIGESDRMTLKFVKP